MMAILVDDYWNYNENFNVWKCINTRHNHVQKIV